MAQNNIGKDIREVLIADGVTTPIYIASEPSTPDAVITLYNTGGEAPNPKWLLDFTGLQARSRANDYETAYDNLQDVFDLLLGRPAFTQNTTRYTGILASSGIMDIGRDDNERRILVCNFRLIVEPALSTQHRKSL